MKTNMTIKNEAILAYLQAEQRHSVPLQDCMRLLKLEKLLSVLKWSGRLFHIAAAA
jgi:hypothetical protein